MASFNKLYVNELTTNTANIVDIEGLQVLNGETFVTPIRGNGSRYGIDPSTNPDPVTGGLLVAATETNVAPYGKVLPFAVAPDMLYATPFVVDPQSNISLSLDGKTFTANKTGVYSVSAYIILAINGVGGGVQPFTPNNVYAFQMLAPSGNDMFTSPPAFSCGSPVFNASLFPLLNAVYAGVCQNSATTLIKLNQGDQFQFRFFIAEDIATIMLTSSVCIEYVAQ